MPFGMCPGQRLPRPARSSPPPSLERLSSGQARCYSWYNTGRCAKGNLCPFRGAHNASGRKRPRDREFEYESSNDRRSPSRREQRRDEADERRDERRDDSRDSFWRERKPNTPRRGARPPRRDQLEYFVARLICCSSCVVGVEGWRWVIEAVDDL